MTHVQIAHLRARAAELTGAERSTIETALRLPVLQIDDERLQHLAQTFQLAPLAVDLLVCLLAMQLDPILLPIVRRLQPHDDDTLELGVACELLSLPASRLPSLKALVEATEPLRRFAIVDLAEDAARGASLGLRLDERVGRYLIGDDRMPEGMERVDPPMRTELPPAPAVVAAAERLGAALEGGAPLVMMVAGAAGTGKRRFAESVAAELRLPLFVVDLARLERRQVAGRLQQAERERLLAGALLCLLHLDHCVVTPASDESGAAGPPRLWPELLPFLREPGVVLATCERDRRALLAAATPAVIDFEIPFPSPSQREALLAAALERHHVALADDVELSAVSRQIALDPRRIDQAARSLVGLGAVSRAELTAACRRQTRHDLDHISERVSSPYTLSDLVMTDEIYATVLEMISFVRYARLVYDDWGFASRHGLSQGISALFTGPPGTGKTMCASVIAHELDMELFRVDLSRVVSKWVGETEKNLSQVFDEAQRSNAIILFDEADALFGKRTQVKSAQDRYANLEVNFLLQRIERFGGVCILTSNFQESIDAAFQRRLTFRIAFEKPDAEARAILWSKAFPDGAALAPDVDVAALGALVPLSGGSIRNAAVRAAFLAAASGSDIDMASCVEAALREGREMGMLVRDASEMAHEPANGAAINHSLWNGGGHA